MSKPVILAFSAFTVQHINLRDFASVTFTPGGLKAERGASTTVQDPQSLISRKDGKWTIKAKNSQNTRTLTLWLGTLKMTTYSGQVVTAKIDRRGLVLS